MQVDVLIAGGWQSVRDQEELIEVMTINGPSYLAQCEQLILIANNAEQQMI